MKFNMFGTSPEKKMRKTLAPRKEFVEKTRGRFLAVFDARHRAAAVTSAAAQAEAARGAGYISATAKTLIACGAFVAIIAGVTAYADTANVPADSTLYPFKRLGENVELALTPSANKPQLEAAIADRRSTEIDDLASRHPTSTILPALANDLTAAAAASLSDASKTDLKDGRLTVFCNTLLSAIATATPSNPRFRGDRAVFGQFEDKCGEHIGASSTAPSPSFSPSYLHLRLPAPVSGATSTPDSAQTSTIPTPQTHGGNGNGNDSNGGGLFHKKLDGKINI